MASPTTRKTWPLVANFSPLALRKAPALDRINLQRVKTKWPLWPSNSTLRLLLAGHRVESNIAAVVTSIELNERYGFISARARGRDGCSERGYGQDTAASGYHLVIRVLCSGVKNLDIFEFCCFVQTRNRFFGFVFAWITSRCDNNGDSGAFIPVDRVIVDLAVDRRLQER